jgi:hypothetical protein
MIVTSITTSTVMIALWPDQQITGQRYQLIFVKRLRTIPNNQPNRGEGRENYG